MAHLNRSMLIDGLTIHSNSYPCCGPINQFYCTVMGATRLGDGTVRRFIHRHYPDGFVLPIHIDTVPE